MLNHVQTQLVLGPTRLASAELKKLDNLLFVTGCDRTILAERYMILLRHPEFSSLLTHHDPRLSAIAEPGRLPQILPEIDATIIPKLDALLVTSSDVLLNGLPCMSELLLLWNDSTEGVAKLAAALFTLAFGINRLRNG